MRTAAWIVVALIAATALAGCTQPPADTTGKGTATSLRVTGYPEHPEPNSDAIVCWRVEGSGNVPHTAVHHGPVSHPNASARFGDYPETIYPGNNTAPASAGYNLPGDFCARIRITGTDVYFRAHVIDSRGGDGMLTDEKRMSPSAMGPPSTVVAVTFSGTTPPSAEPNAQLNVCWTVNGSGRVGNTTLLTDSTTHKLSQNSGDYKGATYYPRNTPQVDPSGYAIPSTFCANVTTPNSGSVFIRAHARLPPPPPGMVSAEEREVRVNQSINATNGVVLSVVFGGSNPSPVLSASRGTLVHVCWNVTGSPGRIPHTAVHTDSTSHVADATATFTDYNGTAYYPGGAVVADPTGYQLTSAQTQFCTDVPAPATAGATLYIRAHAYDNVAGPPGRLSTGEGTITAT